VNLVVDSDVVIKMTKSSAKEAFTSQFNVFVPAEVAVECVEQGKAAGHPDAMTVEENIAQGRIQVRHPRRSDRVETVVRDLRLKGGEAGVVRLFRSGGVDVVVTDDRRFLRILQALDIAYATSSSLIVALAKRGRITKHEALAYLDKLAEYVSEEQLAAAKAAIEGAS
jgi:predicted nucleic acid-binding protein